MVYTYSIPYNDMFFSLVVYSALSLASINQAIKVFMKS